LWLHVIPRRSGPNMSISSTSWHQFAVRFTEQLQFKVDSLYIQVLIRTLEVPSVIRKHRKLRIFTKINIISGVFSSFPPLLPYLQMFGNKSNSYATSTFSFLRSSCIVKDRKMSLISKISFNVICLRVFENNLFEFIIKMTWKIIIRHTYHIGMMLRVVNSPYSFLGSFRQSFQFVTSRAFLLNFCPSGKGPRWSERVCLFGANAWMYKKQKNLKLWLTNWALKRFANDINFQFYLCICYHVGSL
jgi:hypothetical protein